MSSSASPYEISRSQETCAGSGREFAVGEEHIAALLETAGETALSRVLYSMEAWEAGAEFPDGATLFGFWKRRVPEPGESKKTPLVSDDEIFDLFEQLGDATQGKQIGFRYLLALMLMRKKKIELERALPADDDGPARLVVRQKIKGGGGPIFEVVDPKMDDEAIGGAIEELGQVMNFEQSGA
ncbi:MAG: hypothetical protein JKY43_11020 [Phycisphaerales bacterium]|nr:hypothetical protein [Phycisphaerales bacterium]